MNDGYGGIFASQLIRLIGNNCSQRMHISICGGTSAIVSEKTILALIEDVKKGLECGNSGQKISLYTLRLIQYQNNLPQSIL